MRRLKKILVGHDLRSGGRVAFQSAITLAVGMPSIAAAHQGAGPAEMGPPVITAGLIAVVCYWIVVLWPSIKKGESHRSAQMRSD